ncbi:MAG: hypothetical protein EXS22_10810 [Pedosphaera sp.]|nr:hypothetical protein [Pedosphaera sp.]MSU44502.1 hypothetical protein [Pedosphaera sp.]
MNKFQFARFAVLFSLFVLTSLLLTGCGPSKSKHEQLIRQRHKDFITALVQDNYAATVDVVAPDSRKNEGATKLVYGAIRLGIVFGQHRADDFRVDSVMMDDKCIQATVNTSTLTKGAWKPDAKPGNWVREGEQWYLQF